MISRLAACTELMYPETSQTAVEASTIGLLIGEDNFLRNRLFSKLWYQLPYTDHFEFYFGLETKEARRIFCYKEDPSIVLKGPLLTTEYWQYCNGREAPNCLRWRQDKAAQARFSAPQVIRDQLRKCLDQTAVPTPPVETPVNPAPACQWEKIEGLMLGEKVFSEGMKLKNRGFVVSVETEVNCLPLDELLLNLDGLRNYKIAGYKCE